MSPLSPGPRGSRRAGFLRHKVGPKEGPGKKKRMTPRETALAFVEAINAHDPQRLAALMTDGHIFIDSDGTRQTGKDGLRRTWRDYFTMVPDYRIHIEEALARGETVALLGEAEGTFAHEGRLEPENHWRVPAAWRVVVKAGRVFIWQLYVNPEPMAEAFRRVKGE
jgi:ketosteroid isomerase-like protein